MTRSEYLQNHWKSYPAMPVLTKMAGRLISLKKCSVGITVTLWRDSQKLETQLPLGTPLSEVLIEGDIIAITEDLQLVLLAPCLSPQSFVPSFSWDGQRQWNRFLDGLHQFFKELQFLELKTPTLVTCPGTEPTLDVFSTELKIGSRKQKLFLPTSPELHLKKALTNGAEKIYEVAPCFRNGELTERHQPEFLMLEWYRAYSHLEIIKTDVINLVQYLAEVLNVAAPKSVRVQSVRELFRHYCDFDLKPTTGISELKQLADRWNIDVRSAESIDDYFFLIFMEKIESQLPSEELIFVTDYPPYQAALARLTADGWGERFEVYWRGMELANAFHELNDPLVQRQRSSEDLAKKTQMGKEAVPLDEDFFRALEQGMPPSAGIALGVERLYMALTGVADIADLRLFPIK